MDSFLMYQHNFCLSNLLIQTCNNWNITLFQTATCNMCCLRRKFRSVKHWLCEVTAMNNICLYHCIVLWELQRACFIHTCNSCPLTLVHKDWYRHVIKYRNIIANKCGWVDCNCNSVTSVHNSVNISPFQPMLVFFRHIKGLLCTKVTGNSYVCGWTSMLLLLVLPNTLFC